MACVNLESLSVYLANCMHDLASNTELDSENHKMKVMLTPKFRWDVKTQNKHVYQDVTGLRDRCQRAIMFQKKNCNILGFMVIIVYKIKSVGGWG